MKYNQFVLIRNGAETEIWYPEPVIFSLVINLIIESEIFSVD